MLRKLLGGALVLALLFGCSSSAAAQAPASAAPSEIRPTWTPVLLPNGDDGYITDLCFDGDWVILTYAYTSSHLGPLSVTTQFRC